MNATSTFAASVCCSDVSPAACRTIALRRGSTARIEPVAEADPVADRDVDALVQQPPRQAGADDAVGRLRRRTQRDAPRRPAPARGRAPSCSASSGFHPSAPRSNSDNAGSPSGCEERTAQRPSPERSYVRRAASRPRWPWRRQAQSSCRRTSSGRGREPNQGRAQPPNRQATRPRRTGARCAKRRAHAACR